MRIQLDGIVLAESSSPVLVFETGLPTRSTVEHPLVAPAYCASLALIVDEFALLLDLRDVHWQKQGPVFVDLATMLIGGTGVYATALPWARRFVRRRAGRCWAPPRMHR